MVSKVILKLFLRSSGAFGGPGGGFRSGRSSGKPLLLLLLRKPPLGPPKPLPGPPGPPPYSLLAPPVRLLSVLEY